MGAAARLSFMRLACFSISESSEASSESSLPSDDESLSSEREDDSSPEAMEASDDSLSKSSSESTPIALCLPAVFLPAHAAAHAWRKCSAGFRCFDPSPSRLSGCQLPILCGLVVTIHAQRTCCICDRYTASNMHSKTAGGATKWCKSHFRAERSCSI